MAGDQEDLAGVLDLDRAGPVRHGATSLSLNGLAAGLATGLPADGLGEE